MCVATGPRSDAEGLVAGLMNWAQSFGSLKWETGNKAFRQCSTLADFRQAFWDWKQWPGLKGKTGKTDSCAKGVLKVYLKKVSFVWHDSFVRYKKVWYDSFVRYKKVWYDSFVRYSKVLFCMTFSESLPRKAFIEFWSNLKHIEPIGCKSLAWKALGLSLNILVIS